MLFFFTEPGYDEQGLTAWSDSMVHAWDQAAFSNSEPEEDRGLPHEIPQPVFREHDLNRSLDYNILHCTADVYAVYHIFLQDILNENIDFSRLMAGENGFMSVSLHGESLPTDINAVLTPDNNHDVNTFIEQIE